ncbi:nucleoside recognition domain-containing protein [Paenibacillus sp. sgz5001063]|uniref:nucleoside recognition domain-containing protein n=1 Tax=Paenibacillus sp. sgz5001063 TaxID=3242474 RepID=UPI0036D2E91C
MKIQRITSGAAPFAGGAAAILLAIAIVSAPESSFAASLQGLKLWWTLVFPALLPFLILSEMLTASGIIHGIGVLLEPLMNRIFRLPGAGGWTLALGMTAGFPAGAGAVIHLHKQGRITDKEAGRLASLAHYASPVTVLIVVGAAFLHSPASGYVLLSIHWLAGLSAGCTSALFAKRPKLQSAISLKQPHHKRASLLIRINRAAAEARLQDGRSFGRLLGESISTAVQNLMIVGGYMIIFAVVIHIAASVFPQIPQALVSSLLEIHLGANMLTTGIKATSLTVYSHMDALEAAWLSAALGWSGICGQLQALTLLKQAGVSYLPYAANRLLHGMYAFVFTILLWKPLLNLQTIVQPVTSVPDEHMPAVILNPVAFWSSIPKLLGLQVLILLLLLALSAAVYVTASLRRPSA